MSGWSIYTFDWVPKEHQGVPLLVQLHNNTEKLAIWTGRAGFVCPTRGSVIFGVDGWRPIGAVAA